LEVNSAVFWSDKKPFMLWTWQLSCYHFFHQFKGKFTQVLQIIINNWVY